MKLEEFDYNLSKELIAQYPTKRRGSSRLMVLYKKFGKIEHKKFKDIIEYLYEGDVLVVNNTKVFPARLIGKSTTGSKVEVLLLKELKEGEWEALISPNKSKKVGNEILFGEDFKAIIEEINYKSKVKFYYKGKFNDYLKKYGKVPLPPYIKREVEEIDYKRYQTIYAKNVGSCAAPTAGLHFTKNIIKNLKEKGVKIAEFTLHIGLGTFKPIKCENVENHIMEEEYFEINEECIEKIKSAKRVVAVGTSTVRAIESLEKLEPTFNWTNKFIYPGYKFKFVDAMITNFHLPKSTNLLLVCAFAGKENIFNAYKNAIENKYRFYSYGDAMLII